MEILKTPWPEATFISIDLETTGKYPLDAEICEMAAVKWRGGAIVDSFQTLIKPRMRMSEEVIAIHNITNEMCENAPGIDCKLAEFRAFLDGGFLIAHHAPFDMGFLAWEFEKAGLGFPPLPVFCTSLLSRAVNFDVPNHRLATLARHFLIEAGSAHRALDDASTCLQVALKYFQKFGGEAKVSDLLNGQGGGLNWSRFSIETLTEREHLRTLVRALRDRLEVVVTYEGGSRPGTPRRLFPLGLVRQPEADFLVATASGGDADEKPKRYFLEKISSVQFVNL